MPTSKRSYSFAATVLVALSCFTSEAALGGVQEDFAEGNRHNLRGDVVAALPFYKRAAEAGHAGGQAAMGELMRASDFTEEAIVYFRKSALQGNADGQFGLAAMLLSGDGEAQNTPEARKYYILAANQGHVQAIDVMALAYLTGAMGIQEAEKTGPEALKWILLAAENGHRPAMETLAKAYRSGEYALTVDTKKADEWAEKVRKLSGVQPRNKRGKRVISLEKQP
jgi:TPR repeat protein